MSHIHTCSYHCDRPECIKAQRDELRDKLAALESQPVPVEPKPFGYLCEWDSLNQAFYYGEPGSASVDDWNKFPNVHHNLPLYSKDAIDALQSAMQRAQEKYEQAVSNKQIAEAQCAELLQRAEKAEAELKRAQEEHKKEVKELFNIGIHHQQRAEKAEAELKLAQEERDAANDKALRVLRGQFTQICSYCGWEANREGAQWTDLQSHIKQCEHHPLVKAESINRRMVELLRRFSFLAQTTGGTAGRDEGLVKVIDESAELLKEVEK